MIYIFLIWIIGAIFAYMLVFKKWENNSTFEKIWFSAFWPVMIILWIVKIIYRNF